MIWRWVFDVSQPKRVLQMVVSSCCFNELTFSKCSKAVSQGEETTEIWAAANQSVICDLLFGLPHCQSTVSKLKAETRPERTPEKPHVLQGKNLSFLRK